MTTPYELAKEAAAALAEKTGVRTHDIALVLGSGWLPAAEALGEDYTEIDTTDLPGFSAAAVVGHSGKIRSIRSASGRNLLVFLSRTHFYEGKGVDAVVHPVRTAAAAGCSTMVLTNGCGGLNPSWSPGTPVLIRDHIRWSAPTSSTSPTSTPHAYGASPRRWTPPSTRASTSSSPDPTTRPRPR